MYIVKFSDKSYWAGGTYPYVTDPDDARQFVSLRKASRVVRTFGGEIIEHTTKEAAYLSAFYDFIGRGPGRKLSTPENLAAAHAYARAATLGKSHVDSQISDKSLD